MRCWDHSSTTSPQKPKKSTIEFRGGKMFSKTAPVVSGAPNFTSPKAASAGGASQPPSFLSPGAGRMASPASGAAGSSSPTSVRFHTQLRAWTKIMEMSSAESKSSRLFFCHFY